MWLGLGNCYVYYRFEPEINILTIEQTLRMMVDVVADGGNVEFNLGPKPDGTLVDFETERIKAMGDWLAVNGQSIYGADRSPVKSREGFRLTHRPDLNRLYVHVYDWPEDGKVVLTGLGLEVRSASLLANGTKVSTSSSDSGDVVVELPEKRPSEHVTVVAIDYVGEIGG